MIQCRAHRAAISYSNFNPSHFTYLISYTHHHTSLHTSRLKNLHFHTYSFTCGVIRSFFHSCSTTALGWRLRKVAPTTNRPLTDFRTWDVNKECSLVTLTVTIPAFGDRVFSYEVPVVGSDVKAAKEIAAQGFLQEPSVKKLLQSQVESPKKTRGREFMQQKSSSSSLPDAKQPRPCMNTEINQV